MIPVLLKISLHRFEIKNLNGPEGAFTPFLSILHAKVPIIWELTKLFNKNVASFAEDHVNYLSTNTM